MGSHGQSEAAGAREELTSKYRQTQRRETLKRDPLKGETVSGEVTIPNNINDMFAGRSFWRIARKMIPPQFACSREGRLQNQVGPVFKSWFCHMTSG